MTSPSTSPDLPRPDVPPRAEPPHTQPPHTHPPRTEAPPDRRLAAAALTASGATAAMLGWFVARPDLDPLLPDGRMLGAELVPAASLVLVLLASALLGVVVAAAALAGPTARAAGRLVAPVGVLEVVVFGLLAQGSGTLPAAGYLVSFAVPLLALWAGVQVFRTRPAWRLPLALAAALAVVGVVVGRDAFATWWGELSSGLGREPWSVPSVLLPLATAAAWAGLVAVRAWQRGSLRTATAWVTRHRTLFTVVAALGPLPYALARLTWLTPWPQFAGPAEDLTLPVRIQGLSLSSGAWLGIVLTLGLILPWGERLPRWFGRRAGRPVPPAAAIVPGGIVAVMLCGAAVPMIVMMGWAGALYFPAWFWGPALALAVWGYAGHRYGVLDPDVGVSPAAPARPAPASRR
ncbi:MULTISPECIES: hypothetical protein [unclassified Isoptericola]|uniref:hypothetical protein n=1 Tax=unclassified Isoptericola TaxID=2623355 RepID=UPI00364F8307